MEVKKTVDVSKINLVEEIEEGVCYVNRFDNFYDAMEELEGWLLTAKHQGLEPAILEMMWDRGVYYTQGCFKKGEEDG